MNWFSKRRRDADSEEDEHLPLEVIVKRAYDLTLHSLGDNGLAEELALEVTDNVTLLWRQEERKHPYNTPGSPTPYKIRPNRAAIVDRVTFSELNRYKQEWARQYQKGQRSLDRETLAVWFVEEIVNYSLRHNLLYTIIGVCKVLFNYKYEEICAVIDPLDPQERFPDDADLRRLKKKFFDHLHNNNLFSDFLRLEEVNRETRFASKEVNPDDFLLVEDALYKWTPLKPACPLAGRRYSSLSKPQALLADRIAYLLKAHSASESDQAVERERMHMLVHPHCFRSLLYALNLPPPETSLELPDFQLKDAGGPPFNRRDAPPMSDEQSERVQALLGRRKIRREHYSYECVKITVNDEDLPAVFLGEKRAVRLVVNVSTDNLIKIQGQDDEGSLPLGVHLISFDEDQLDGSLSLTARLGKGLVLRLDLSFERDARGDFADTVVIVLEYSLSTASAPWRALPQGLMAVLARAMTGRQSKAGRYQKAAAF